MVRVVFTVNGETHTISAGDVVQLHGANGSGKTTLLRAMAGLPTHRFQDVTIDGENPAQWGPAEAAAIGRVCQDPQDNLLGLTVAGEYAMRQRAAPDDRRPVADLSNGMMRRLAIALAQGRLLLLDEPAQGLDAEGMGVLEVKLAAAETVVFSDHTGQLDHLATKHVSLDSEGPGVAWHVPEVAIEEALIGPLNGNIARAEVTLSGGFVAVTGPNGSGKSTWLRHARKQLDDAIMLSHDAASAIAVDAVPEIDGIPDALHGRHPMTLSGGERQRVALAIVFAKSPRTLLLDEPTHHLDAEGQAWLIQKINDALAKGRRVIMATHDASCAEAAHQAIAMEGA